MLLVIGLIGMVILAVGCAVFVGLTPSEKPPVARREPAPQPSRFFVAPMAEGRPSEALIRALMADLERHIREEGRIAEGFALRMDPETLRTRPGSGWVN